MSSGPMIERARRAAVLVALACVLLAGRSIAGTAPVTDGGPAQISAGAAGEHALVALARTAGPTVAAAVSPIDLPRTAPAWAATAAWGLCLLLALAALPPSDRVRRWRARMQGAPPLVVVLRTHE